jgi:hypothetical protein
VQKAYKNKYWRKTKMNIIEKNVTKYVNYNESKYTWGQKADGTWYCKEFKSDTIEEGEQDINIINKMLNKFNKKLEKPIKNQLKTTKGKINKPTKTTGK